MSLKVSFTNEGCTIEAPGRGALWLSTDEWEYLVSYGTTRESAIALEMTRRATRVAATLALNVLQPIEAVIAELRTTVEENR